MTTIMAALGVFFAVCLVSWLRRLWEESITRPSEARQGEA